jgi:hypothetical protein
MNFTGLSLDQAPPYSAPIRFFLTAPLFGMLAAILLLFFEDSLQSRYASEVIALTHLFTIGMLSMVMLGAMQQMLPVLAGVRLPYASKVAAISHAFLVIGTLSMVAGIVSGNSIMMLIAVGALGIGFLVIIGAIFKALLSVTFFTPTIKAISTSLLMALITVLLGLHLLSGHALQNISALHQLLSNIHIVLGVFGFAGLLIIGVSFQVLPMFYVTPEFKKFCLTFVVPVITFGLFLWIILNLIMPEFAYIAKGIIALFFFAFSTAVLKKMKERRRPLSDVTVWYWRSAALFLLFGTFIWSSSDWIDFDVTLITALLIGSFILSIVSAMIYKIVPFLTWFHLNGLGYMNIPTMRELINAKVAKVQFLFFITSIMILLGLAFFTSIISDSIFHLSIVLASLLLLASMILLEYNLVMVVKQYCQIRSKKSDMELMQEQMNAMQEMSQDEAITETKKDI